jgi:transcription-repair coupling factor (superfamily II helicase)
MSLLGLRDVSVLSTPPQDRLAIRTVVIGFDPPRLREAILHEMARGGQVFFVHNRVENIEYIASHLRTIVPEAKIAVVIGGQASTRQAKQRLGRILRKTGSAQATLYEVVCETAGETERSRQRRRRDAYERTRHRRV